MILEQYEHLRKTIFIDTNTNYMYCIDRLKVDDIYSIRFSFYSPHTSKFNDFLFEIHKSDITENDEVLLSLKNVQDEIGEDPKDIENFFDDYFERFEIFWIQCRNTFLNILECKKDLILNKENFLFRLRQFLEREFRFILKQKYKKKLIIKVRAP